MSTVCDIDPFAAIEQMAHRQVAEREAAKNLSVARCKLVLGKDAKATFFATLALGMKPVVDWSMPTMATDGKHIFYNPDFVNGLTPSERIGVVCHEVLHPAHAHHARREGRDYADWNKACDAAINPIVQESGYRLPDDALFPGTGDFSGCEKGMAAESYYNHLKRKKKDDDKQGGGDSCGQGDGKSQPGADPGGCGGVIDAGDHAQQAEAEANYKVKVAQAVGASQSRGELPGSLARLVKEVLEPEVQWQAVLAEFVSRSVEARDDYSWEMPERSYIQQGLYLPSLHSEGMGEIVIAIDVSGSVDDDMLKEFSNEMNGILECKPCRVSVVYCDAFIQKVEEWQPSDGPLTLEACGGGCTSHEPVWEWLANHDGDPACVVCLTDLFTRFGKGPDVPVLWAVTGGNDRKPPFGRVVHVV